MIVPLFFSLPTIPYLILFSCQTRNSTWYVAYTGVPALAAGLYFKAFSGKEILENPAIYNVCHLLFFTFINVMVMDHVISLSFCCYEAKKYSDIDLQEPRQKVGKSKKRLALWGIGAFAHALII